MAHANITLQKPSIRYKDSYLEMLQEYRELEEKLIPWVLTLDAVPFQGLVETLHKQEKGFDLPPGYTPGSTFWLVENDRRILGATNIRHYLNDGLRRIGGHIGYGIRPSERQKGYATLMLRLALEKARKLGIPKVLLTCDKSNIASAKVMLNNGAMLESEEQIDGRKTQRYWITIQ